MTELIQHTLQAVSAEHIESHIKALQGVRHPVFAPEALERSADYIKHMLGSLGCECSEHRFIDDERESRNIIGLRRGIRNPQKYVVVLAHYDTESETPGANDNASGVAAMLELARVFQHLHLANSILFVGVSLEERRWGIASQDANLDRVDMAIARGSQALAAHIHTEGWDIQGVINLEEIAFAGDDVIQKSPPGLPVSLPEFGNFIGVIGNENSSDLVKGFVQSIARYRITLPCVPLVVPGNGEILPDTRRSDHAPFWDLGYKAIMVTDTGNFRTPHYHQPSDTLETLNLEFAVQVCRATGGLILDLAGFLDAE